MELDGRVVLLTGAARRVGRAIALRLARAGCHLALHYRDSATEAREVADACRQMGVTVELFPTDLANDIQTSRLVPAVLDRFDQLDVLVNNAAEFRPMSLESFALADWEHTLRVNLTAPMMLAHAARAALKRAGGYIVNICDVATQRPWPNHLAYIVSKGGLDTLTYALARAMAPEVNVVGIAPGAVAWPENYDARQREILTARIPLKRAGTVEDVAALVHFVLSAGEYITGTIIPVDGGRHVV
ncbi:MAG: SDR family oxidoreductase [Planctomycetota bacterium]